MPEIFQKGTLYLCPTPIGNLEDITYRTVRCLREADLIAAEDTRHTKQLLMAYDIDTPLTSYHEHNKAEKGPQLIEKLKDGLMIALVSALTAGRSPKKKEFSCAGCPGAELCGSATCTKGKEEA